MANARKVSGIFVRCGKAWISAVGLSRQRELHVGDGDISLPYFILNVAEIGAEVICSILLRILYLVFMHHYVSQNPDGDGVFLIY